MRSKRLRVVVALATVLSALVASSAAAPVDPPSVADEHRRVVEFWTNERVSQAVPRDFVMSRSGRFEPVARGGSTGKPDKGDKPGGDDSSTGTTGSSWEGEGVVAGATGKVLFAMGPSYYVCSASVVADTAALRSIVLTAAHCAYDETTGLFATNWMFIPDYDESPAELDTVGNFCEDTLYGCWTAASLVVHDGYASAGGFNVAAVRHDFAFAVLGTGGKDTSLVEDVTATQRIEFDSNRQKVVVDAFGYPAAAPYSGDDLVYCEGPVGFDGRTGKTTYKLGCDMTGGASGGPWFRGFDAGSGVLTSLNSYRYSGGGSMYGPIFNSDTRDLYEAALLTSQSVVVP